MTIINDIQKTAQPNPERNVTQPLESWCKTALASNKLPTNFRLSTVSGDASFRAYYRVHLSSDSYIAVTAPPATENNHEFVVIAKCLATAGILVPKVLAVDYEQGFLLLSDLGDQMLLPLLNANSVLGYYRSALDELVTLQRISAQSVNVAAYDAEALQLELAVFSQWFLNGLLAYQPNQAERYLLQQNNSVLLDSAQSQPARLVHRDYHARNIMCVDKRLAMIDFQDALWGPVSYDVVSLLKDCYVKWPRETVLDCLAYYHQQAQDELDLPCFEVFTKQFDLMGLQRHLKVLGVFARLSIRDNKHGYLADLPRVMAYVSEAAALYDETRAFGQWFDQTVRPIAQQQAWSAVV